MGDRLKEGRHIAGRDAPPSRGAAERAHSSIARALPSRPDARPTRRAPVRRRIRSGRVPRGRSRARSPSPAARAPSLAAATSASRAASSSALPSSCGREFLVRDALDGRGHPAMHRHAAGRHRHVLVPSNQGRRVPQVDDLRRRGHSVSQWRWTCRSCAIRRKLAAEGLVGAVARARSRPASACGSRACLRR